MTYLRHLYTKWYSNDTMVGIFLTMVDAMVDAMVEEPPSIVNIFDREVLPLSLEP